ncbi:MAG: DUF58 domain-containing protein [Ferrovibrio sp.]|nr:DUF58 domain-containing protein [Ferrovibrio sp.]
MPGNADSVNRAENFAAFLPPLLLAAERVAATVEQGVHGRRRTGAGDAFWQFRRYSPGDSIGRIDWRQTAKRMQAFVRENEWEAAESVWLWRDPSPSMAWASPQALERKDQRADLLVLACASLLLRGGERVALLGAPERPSAGRRVLPRMAERLALQRQSVLAGTDAERAAASLPPPAALPRHGQAVLFGDFLYPLPEIAARLRGLADQGVKGCVVRIVDPAEEDFPYKGRTRFLGLEGEGEMLAPRAETLADDWRAAFAAHQAGLADICRRLGWHHIKHRTDKPAEALLMALYLALEGGNMREGRRR